ncbi:MAG TPA: KUP/HAK/KT family potassium transporter [Gammaproteobacteria bacterium]|nr:KUP/HAK/KT family potassium transporter [Gammaproteobacteria bacterium]
MLFKKFFSKPGRGEDDAQDSERRRQLWLSFLTLGVVFGDIGTSPLYAVRESLLAIGHAPSTEEVLGIISLVIWALILVICFKYQIFVLRADNRGDGGIIALIALLRHRNRPGAERQPVGTPRRTRRQWVAAGAWVLVLGTFGASLLYGDGMITPAISVLSAVEGLRIAAPTLGGLIIPITCIILFFLFWFQRKGTSGVATWFAPIMMVWFLVLAGLGLASFVQTPTVLLAFNPAHAVDFFIAHKKLGFIVLGSVFLAVTGGEVLYADLGHFGAPPVRRAWFALVFPSLLLNYLGQGALALREPAKVSDLFYALAPAAGGTIAVYILVAVATMATVIASQAAISGAFSLMTQAIGLNISPRVKIERTSRTERGQVYIPSLNVILMIACIVLVLTFRSSSNLAGAYGVAISTDMLITTLLMYIVMRRLWHWSWWKTIPLIAVFLAMDIPFWGANMIKLDQGGWVPIMIALIAFAIMRVWTKNRERLIRTLRSRTDNIAVFLDRLGHHMPKRVPGTAVFLAAPGLGVPPMLKYHLRHNQVLHEQVLLLSVMISDEPTVKARGRLEVVPLGYGFYQVTMHFGFKQEQNVLIGLKLAAEQGLLDIDPERLTFYIGRETLVPASYGGPLHGPRQWFARYWRKWRRLPEPERAPGQEVGIIQAISERVFVLMHRNAMRATDFFKIPDDRTVEFGLRVRTTALTREEQLARQRQRSEGITQTQS